MTIPMMETKKTKDFMPHGILLIPPTFHVQRHTHTRGNIQYKAFPKILGYRM
jgi:hypothetical protein